MKAVKNRGTLPSQIIKQKEEEKLKREEQKDQDIKDLRGAIARISNTPDGRYFLRWLRNECGFGDSFLGINPTTGEIDPQRTTYSAMRLNLWWKIRKLIPIKQLIEVEHD